MLARVCGLSPWSRTALTGDVADHPRVGDVPGEVILPRRAAGVRVTALVPWHIVAGLCFTARPGAGVHRVTVPALLQGVFLQGRLALLLSSRGQVLEVKNRN